MTCKAPALILAGLMAAACSRPEAPARFADQLGEPITFDFRGLKDGGGWASWNHMTPFTAAADGVLAVSTGNDPFFRSPQLSASLAMVEIRMRVERNQTGTAHLLWITADDPNFGTNKKDAAFPIAAGADFVTYTVKCLERRKVLLLRVDPTDTEGSIEIAWIKLYPFRP